jgi:NADPH:quinone reductase-like Zn-dependent oxidoreductase
VPHESWEVREPTGLDGLALNRERAVPTPGSPQIVMRVRAAALNYRDHGMLRGVYGYTKFPTAMNNAIAAARLRLKTDPVVAFDDAKAAYLHQQSGNHVGEIVTAT